MHDGLDLQIWHNAVRSAVTGERLYYWRFTTNRFATTEVVAKVREFLEGHDPPCRSYAIYETFGDWDVLLRCWLPLAISPDEFELRLVSALSPLGVDNAQFLSVHEVLRHHAFGTDIKPTSDSPEALLSGVDVDRIEERNRVVSHAAFVDPETEPPPLDKATAEAIRDAHARGLTASLTLGRQGIRFCVTFGYPRVPLQPAQRRDLNTRLLRTCESVLTATRALGHEGSRLSLYSGYGTMTTHLITGQAPDSHFYSFSRRLIQALHDEGLTTLHQMKPLTTVYAERDASFICETLKPTTVRMITAEDLEILSEDESLELKASVWLDARGLLRTGGHRASFEGGPDAIGKAVCGMLNRSGGVVVVGLGELSRLTAERFASGQVRAAVETLQLPRNDRGDLVIFGLEEEYENPQSKATDWDSWLRFVSSYLGSKITPNPTNHFAIALRELRLPPRYGSRTLGLIHVSPPRDRQTWFYFNDQFYVRYEGSSVPLRGKTIDDYRNALLGQGPPDHG